MAFKITIDNEEVVSNKDFVIQEEMLNTPSVILNNVYPKSWEEDRDYVSKFYHPKDYSQCKIFNEEIIPATEGETIEGTNLNINYDDTKKFEFSFKGQNGIVTGRQEINIVGKNLLKPAVTNNGVDIFTSNCVANVNDDIFSFTASGVNFNFGVGGGVGSSYLNDRGVLTKVAPSTNYSVSLSNNTFHHIYITEYDINKISLGGVMLSGTSGTFTTKTSTEYITVAVFYQGATVGETYSTTIQLEVGEPTSYEKYEGQEYEINLGKNLFNPQYEIETQYLLNGNVSSDSQYVLDNGIISCDKSNNTYGVRFFNKLTLEAGTYTWSCDVSQTNNTTTNARKRIRNFTNATDISASANVNISSGKFSLTFTLTTTTQIGLMLKPSNDTDGTIYMSNIQLEYGEQSSYAQYKTPIELTSENDEIYQENNVWYLKKAQTISEITDTELIRQLNQLKLSNGENNITISSPSLSMIIKLHYNFNEEYTIDDLIFCGVVKNSGNISLNPRDPHFQTLQILSYKTFLSEGETLDFVIYQKTIYEAILQVIEAISSYGFVIGNVNILNPNEVIGAYSTKDKSAYDVFNYIADITQSRWTTRLIDDTTIAIDFFDPTLMEQGLEINYTEEFFENNLIDNISYSYGTNDYRNKQVMTSNQVFGNLSQVQVYYANGYQTQFTTELLIGNLQAIFVDGTQMSIATNEEKNRGIIADFYYSTATNIIESDITYPAGSRIEIDYIPIVEGRQIITNNEEIERISNTTQVKGVIARYENRNDAITSNELQLIGQSYLKYKGSPEIVLTIQTRANLWNIGERIQFNAPIEALNTEYMVRSKKTNRIMSVDTIFYTYEMTSSFNSETEINYFDNQRAKAKGNIADGEFISKNVDIENTANIIFFGSSYKEITPMGNNVLNSVLNAPLDS